MKKVKNIKPFFNDVLKNKYHMTNEGISGYWENKEQEEKFENKRGIATAVGFGEMAGTLGFTVWDVCAGGKDCIIPITIFAGVAVLTTAVALFKDNPYSKKEYEEIDEDYETAKRLKK